MPDSTLDKLRAIAAEIDALPPDVSHADRLAAYRRRRELVREALADERSKAAIGRALGVSRERIHQLAA